MKNPKIQISFKLWKASLRLLFLLSAAVFVCGQTPNDAQFQDLQPNQTLEREMTGAQTHRYKFDLKNGEFFQVRVEQKGVDVVLKLTDASGNVLATMDSPNGTTGFETITFVAEKAGGLVLEVASLDAKAAKGNYILVRLASRTTTAADKRRVEIEKLFVEAIAARDSGQGEAAIEKLKAALAGWEELKDDSLVRLTTQNIGLLKNKQAEDLSKNNKAQEAAVLYAEAESFFKKSGDIGQEALAAFYAFNAESINAHSRTDEGKKFLFEGKNESALKARSIFKEVLETQYRLSRKWDEVFEKIENAKESLKLSSETIAELNELNRDGIKFREESALTNIAQTHHFFGEFEEELNYQKLALSALREGRAGKSKEASSLFRKYNEASNLGGIGLSLSNLKKYQESIEYRQQAVRIYRELEKELPQFIIELQEAKLDKALNVTSGIQSLRFQEGQNLNSIAQSYIELEQRQKAVEYFEQALTAYEPLTDDASKKEKAQVLSAIGNEYYNSFEPEKALSYIDKSLKLYQELGDRKDEADSLMMTATVYKSLGADKKADEYYRQVLDILLQLNSAWKADLLSPYLTSQAEFFRLNQIAVLNRALGDNKKSIEYFEKALAFAGSSNDYFKLPLSSIGGTYSSIGDIYFSEENNKPKAFEYFQKANEFSRRSLDKRSIAFELRSLGTWYLDAGNPQEALKIYNEVFAIYQSIGIDGKTVFSPHYATTLSYLARIHGELGNRRLAIFYGKLCVNAIQQERQHLLNFEQDLQKGYLSKNEKPYRGLADRLVAEGRLVEAEQVLAMLKQEEINDYLRGNAASAERLSLRIDFTPTEKKAFDDYQKNAEPIAALGSEMSKLEDLQRGGVKFSAEQEKRLAELKTKLTEANVAFQNFLSKLAEEFKNNKNPERDLRENFNLQSELESYGEGLVFVYTLVGEDKFSSILVTPNAEISHQEPKQAAELNKKIFEFREAVKNPNIDPRPLGKELYDILIKPFEKDLDAARAKTILWYLDGNLRLLPIAALWDGKQYFGQKYQNVVITGKSIQNIGRDVSSNPTVLGLGVSESKTVPETLTERKFTFQSLPSVPFELGSIVKTANSPKGVLQGESLLNAVFTRKSFAEQLLKKYKIIHIASHFSMNAGDASRSFLLLGDGTTLAVSELNTDPSFKNKFAGVELLTLSACETAVSETDSNGKEVEGFAYVAQQNGAKAILATLWSVTDESTALLMSEFYRLRKENPQMTKAEAMQAAQKEMIEGKLKPTTEEGKKRAEIVGTTNDKTNAPPFIVDKSKPFAHPYYWSPFVLIGNWK